MDSEVINRSSVILDPGDLVEYGEVFERKFLIKEVYDFFQRYLTTRS